MCVCASVHLLQMSEAAAPIEGVKFRHIAAFRKNPPFNLCARADCIKSPDFLLLFLPSHSSCIDEKLRFYS